MTQAGAGGVTPSRDHRPRIQRRAFILPEINDNAPAHAGDSSRRDNSVRFLRSGRQTLAAVTADLAYRRRALFSPHRAFCADAIRGAAYEFAVFVAPVKGPTQGPAKAKSGGATFDRFVTLAEVWRGPTGGPENRNSSANAAGEAAK